MMEISLNHANFNENYLKKSSRRHLLIELIVWRERGSGKIKNRVICSKIPYIFNQNFDIRISNVKIKQNKAFNRHVNIYQNWQMFQYEISLLKIENQTSQLFKFYRKNDSFCKDKLRLTQNGAQQNRGSHNSNPICFCFFIINKKKQMPKRNSSWTLEEEQTLKQLKEAQIKDNVVDWESITNIMNQKFPKFFRNSKQCRQKYVSHLKITNRDDIYEDWSKEEMQILRNIYEKFGPSWCLMSQTLKKRSQNCIKNKFNTCLRKAASTLYSLQKGRKNITANILGPMLEFTNSLRKKIQEMQLTVNNESTLYIFRSKILKLCFEPLSFEKEDCLELIRLIKNLNLKIRCFGAFKSKSKRKFKISQNGFNAICIKEKVIIQWANKSNMMTQVSQYLTPGDNSCMDDNDNNFDQDDSRFSQEMNELPIPNIRDQKYESNHLIQQFQHLMGLPCSTQEDFPFCS